MDELDLILKHIPQTPRWLDYYESEIDLDKKYARSAVDCLNTMIESAKNFDCSVRLFDYCGNEVNTILRNSNGSGFEDINMHIKRNWMYAAAREASMSAYHFAKATEGLKACIKKLPEAKIVDQTAWKEATKIFDSSFPDYIGMRNAIAHSAELTSNPDQYKNNSLKGELEDVGISIKGNNSTVFIKNYIINSTFANTIKGNLVKCEIDKNSTVALYNAYLLIRDSLNFDTKPPSP